MVKAHLAAGSRGRHQPDIRSLELLPAVFSVGCSLMKREWGQRLCGRSGNVVSPHPHCRAGIVQMIGVFSDTIIICTASAMIVNHWRGITRPTRQQKAFSFSNMQWFSLTGEWGASFVALIVILFAFSSIVANIFTPKPICFLRLHNAGHLAITPCDAWHGYRRYVSVFR